MGIYANLNNEISKNLDSFNIILADKDVDTFKKIQKLNNKFNFINLSSYFAVSFILEYEKIDLIIISRKISNLSDIIKKADKKKINVYVLGKDISLPVNEKEIENIILKEIERKASSKKNRRFDFKKCISNLLNLDINRKLILRPGFKNQEKIKKHSKEAEKENKSEYKKRVKIPKLNEKKILKRMIAFSVIPLFFILFFSGKPIYPFYSKDDSLIKFAFKYTSRYKVDCKEATEKETETKLKHMRKTQSPFPVMRMNCTGERLPVKVLIFLDEKNVLTKTYYPAGLKKDGPSFAYEEIITIAGKHKFRVSITDSKTDNPLNYIFNKEIDIKSGEVAVIDLTNRF